MQFADFDAFPAPQRVTYKFYVGRLAVFDENYVSLGCRSHGCLPCCLPVPALLCPSLACTPFPSQSQRPRTSLKPLLLVLLVPAARSAGGA